MFNSVIEFKIALRMIRSHDKQPGFACTVYSVSNEDIIIEKKST